MFGDNLTVVTIDIKNAFNSINQKAIIHALQNKGCPPSIIAYVKAFMETRYCIIKNDKNEDILLKAKSGVPQGDPLSSFLFSLAIEPIIQSIKNDGHKVAVFLDDFLIGTKLLASRIIEKMT